MSRNRFGFDGFDETGSEGRLGVSGCKYCGKPLHEHDKERVYPEKGPTGSYHWKYECLE